LKGRPLLRIFVAAALMVILTAVLPLVSGCSQLPPTSPTASPARDKGVPPPLYRPGTADQTADVQPVGQTGQGDERESPDEPIAPET
jgi:hypothetical protein